MATGLYCLVRLANCNHETSVKYALWEAAAQVRQAMMRAATGFSCLVRIGNCSYNMSVKYTVRLEHSLRKHQNEGCKKLLLLSQVGLLQQAIQV